MQWQYSINGTTYSNISGTTSATFSFTPAANQTGYQYREVFTNAAGSATSGAATLTVYVLPVVTSYPSSQTVAIGQTVSFTAAATGTPTPAVQWQVSSNGGTTYANVSGVPRPHIPLHRAASQSGYMYREVFTNAAGATDSTAAVLTVDSAPVATTNPAGQTAVYGNSATFTAAASGSPAPTVQWQVQRNGGASFMNISGATSTSLTVTAVQTGYQYRAVFTNSVGTATTTAAALTVIVPPVVTTNPASLSVTSGQTATFTAAASGTPAPTVQWQVSANGGATYANVSGATSTTYSLTPTTAQSGYRYRAVFTNSAARQRLLSPR